MVCKIVSRLSREKYRVETSLDGKKYTVNNSISGDLNVGDYVVVTDLCIVGRTSTPSYQGTFKV